MNKDVYKISKAAEPTLKRLLKLLDENVDNKTDQQKEWIKYFGIPNVSLVIDEENKGSEDEGQHMLDNLKAEHREPIDNADSDHEPMEIDIIEIHSDPMAQDIRKTPALKEENVEMTQTNKNIHSEEIQNKHFEPIISFIHKSLQEHKNISFEELVDVLKDSQAQDYDNIFKELSKNLTVNETAALCQVFCNNNEEYECTEMSKAFSRRILLPKLLLEETTRNFEVTLANFTHQFTQIVIEEVLLPILMSSEKFENAAVMSLVETLDDTSKQMMISTFLSTFVTNLKPHHTILLEKLLPHMLANAQDRNRLITLISESSKVLSKDKDFGKLLLSVAKNIPMESNEMRVNFKAAVNAHETLYKRKIITYL